jgi:hypothetical protein
MNYFNFAAAMARTQFARPNYLGPQTPAEGSGMAVNPGSESPAPNPPTSLERYSIYPRSEADQEQDYFEKSDDQIFGNRDEQEHR